MTTNQTPSVQQALHALIAAVRAEEARWYHAVDQIAVTQDMAVNIDDPDPYARLLEIVSWSAEVACDPAVSAKARELIAHGEARATTTWVEEFNQRLRAKLTPTLNTGTAMDMLVLVGEVLGEMKAKAGQ